MLIRQYFDNSRPFFRKLAVLLSLYAIGATFLCFSAIRYFFNGEIWLTNGEVILGVLTTMLVFAVFSFYNFLWLDGQLGSRRTHSQTAQDN